MNQVIYRERRNTDSMKWDSCGEKFGNKDLLPLWVADMDFAVPECVKDAIKEYADFGVFGYYNTPMHTVTRLYAGRKHIINIR